MMKLIMLFHQEALRAIERGADFQALITLPVREQIARSRYLAEDDLAAMDQIEAAIREQIADLSGDDLEQAYA
jgi:V/A-type H+-transporting ATPase subunit A